MKLLPILLLTCPLLNPLVSAGSCTKDPAGSWHCGRVINNSKITLRYTTNPNTGGTNQCRFWNWSGGGLPANALVQCTQISLFAGDSIGGAKNGGAAKGTDVDAFTFTYVDYWVQSGTRRVTKGVWTKINDATTITCVGGDDGGMPYCY